MDTRAAYEQMRAYFSRPGAVLARAEPITDEKGFTHGDSSCYYRTPMGDKCAVGCLIPNELYDPNLEGHGYTFVVDYFEAHGIDLFADVNQDFLEKAQNLHDYQAVDAMDFVRLLDGAWNTGDGYHFDYPEEEL